MLRRSILLASLAVLACAPATEARYNAPTDAGADSTATAALPRARIVAMGMREYGRGSYGSSYYVEVAVRVRLCGKFGSAYFHITETKSSPNQNSPVWARTRRTRSRLQDYPCQTGRFTWILADKFFGNRALSSRGESTHNGPRLECPPRSPR